MGIDKRQLKRKLIISHGALQRFAPTLEKGLNSNIAFTLAAGQRHQRYSTVFPQRRINFYFLALYCWLRLAPASY